MLVSEAAKSPGQKHASTHLHLFNTAHHAPDLHQPTSASMCATALPDMPDSNPCCTHKAIRMVHLAQARLVCPCPASTQHGPYQHPWCCGSEQHPEVPEEALLTLIDLLTDSRANARVLVAAEREGAALFQRYLRTCGTAGRQVHAVHVPARS